eukprot:gnl/MRDRNA2_/MRDRNA2_88358_c0_seq1.p1 gnl/MRDRNA2_/MRDRNA2_88358_c0~~gnl/MRDRNA2_/MRDRNA2_88358_c0_seq1.p1  ORF type:complete len:229 (-),score=46.44 gnl/MRDRNA2_/MRDRNA2_88358_c0_seq1:101-787(-)
MMNVAVLLVTVCYVPVIEAGHLRLKAEAGANTSSAVLKGPEPQPGGPVAVQIDWLINQGVLKDLQGALSGTCEGKMKEAVAMSSVTHSLKTAQKAEDAPTCLNAMSGRVCHSKAIFNEDKQMHKKRNPATQFTVWDLHTNWDWCLPKDCADTDDLRKIAVFMRMRIGELVQPETAPMALQTALLIDCQGSGGGYVFVDHTDKWTFKAAAPSLLPGIVCLASVIMGFVF